MAFIDVSSVSKTFATDRAVRCVLDNATLSVDQGEFVSIVGVMGCGKSTLLGIIAGLVLSDEGEVRFDGVLVRGVPPKTSIVFQNYSLLPWLTAFENVHLAVASAWPLWPADRQANQAHVYLRKVGLASAAHRRPSQLSGGMRQRVAIGRALAIDTPIVLMDEPFGALDEQTRVLMGEWLLDIWRRTRKTVVFVTHSLHEALALSTRVVVMTARPGRIKSVLELPMPYPRAMESAELVALRAKLWSDIRDESLRAMQS